MILSPLPWVPSTQVSTRREGTESWQRGVGISAGLGNRGPPFPLHDLNQRTGVHQGYHLRDESSQWEVVSL